MSRDRAANASATAWMDPKTRQYTLGDICLNAQAYAGNRQILRED
jgi:hypothetical protein